jgi:hypothetical protein
MEFMKYVMFNETNAVIFDPVLSHKDVARGIGHAGFAPTSAGFFQVAVGEEKLGEIKISCFGESETLKLKANPKDAFWIAKRLDPYRD